MDQKIHISLKDTGMGIESSYLKTLATETDFDDEILNLKSKPNLGMKICNQFIRVLNGELSIHSTPGLGTEISIIVPNYS